MFALGAGLFVAFIVFSINAKKFDVVLKLFGYLFAWVAILIGLFFGCLYLYSNFVIGLWHAGASL